MRVSTRRELESRVSWVAAFCFLGGMAVGALQLPRVQAWPLWERMLLMAVPLTGAVWMMQSVRSLLTPTRFIRRRICR